MAMQMLEQCVEADIFKPDEIQSKLGIVSTSTFLNLLMSIMSGTQPLNVFNTLIEGDYNANFNLMFKVISDAECYRVFGVAPGNNEFFNKQAKTLAEHPNFSYVRNAFCEFAQNHQAYFKKTEYVVFMSTLFDMCSRNSRPTGVTELQKRAVRKPLQG